MHRGLNNWAFTDVIRFLKDNGFRHNKTKGSHYFYIAKYNKKLKQVCVPFHGRKSIHPKVMKSIILQSGIPQDKWLSL